eukprot:TRINITY_DN27479_c0_g1_i1.p1 TRINITY_DN27479_c0_g1~~TRINITY_DN27479_c0_g1_i1.p1  ORF type:complete len:413 (-),score=61.58 TRINITY_DN27479_c0_g1_i1:245-1483(-)
MSLSLSELKSRASKFEREAKEQAAKEQARKLRQQRLKEKQIQKQLEQEQQLREQRFAEQAAQEQRQLEIETEIARNRGIRCEAQLRAQALDEQSVQQRGIKRRLDKLVLPPTMEAQLLQQNAPKNGTLLFEVRAENGRYTHAGVLDFTAPEGTVLIPKKVVNCLWGNEAEAQGQIVHVSYKFLRKGSFVEFQPANASFQKDVGDEISNVLEAALTSYCTLTQGDIVHVHYNEIPYELKVLTLQPDPEVSIIDTEMEAEIRPSIEYEDKLREEEELKRLKEEELRRAKEAEELRQKQLQEVQSRQRYEQQLRIQQAKSKLSPEADPSEDHVLCVFRLPSGNRTQRRFYKHVDVTQLFHFIDSLEQEMQQTSTQSFRLVTQFPRRVVERELSGSLEQQGFVDKAYVFFVEVVQQ